MSVQKIDFSLTSTNDTHREVQDYYGARARNTASCCGGDSCCSSGDSAEVLELYDSRELASLPGDVASF